MDKPGHPAQPYLLAIAATGVGLLIRVPAWALLRGETPFITLYPAVALTAMRGGFWPGLSATLLSCLSANYFFIDPVYSLGVANAADHVSTLYFALFGVLISYVGERLRASRRETEAQRRLTYQTLASIGDGVIATDTHGCITFLNTVAENMTGWSLDEAQNKRIGEVFKITHEDTGAAVENPIDRVLREGRIVGLANHTVLAPKGGGTIPIDDSGAPIRDARGKVIGAVLVFRDITERRATERRLAKNARRLSQLVEANIFGVLFADIHGHITGANDEFLRMIGRTREELVAGRLKWTEITPEEYMPQHMRAIEEARERGACTPFEKEYLRPDGVRIPALMGFILLEPEREESVAFVADLTERKKTERALRQINEDLQHFTYGAGHDLQEPLRMVASYVQLLERRYRGKLGEDADDYIHFIMEGVERMRALVLALLEYSRAGEVTRTIRPVRAQAALDKTLMGLKTAIEEANATVISHDLPQVMVDELHLTQLFQNLITNSIKYADKEPPRIEISARSAGDMHEFTVKDNGLGIACEYQEKVFGVFQRLHGREFSGTGLGLATCRRIVEVHGGRIWVESQGEGFGTSFHFTLPAGVGQRDASA